MAYCSVIGKGNHARRWEIKMADACIEALKAAKKFVAYIEYFNTHGTGDCMRKYPDDETFDGYNNMVRRARQLADHIENIDGGWNRRQRKAIAESLTKAGY